MNLNSLCPLVHKLSKIFVFRYLWIFSSLNKFKKRPDCVGIGCSETRKFQEDKINYKKVTNKDVCCFPNVKCHKLIYYDLSYHNIYQLPHAK